MADDGAVSFPLLFLPPQRWWLVVGKTSCTDPRRLHPRPLRGPNLLTGVTRVWIVPSLLFFFLMIARNSWKITIPPINYLIRTIHFHFPLFSWLSTPQTCDCKLSSYLLFRCPNFSKQAINSLFLFLYWSNKFSKRTLFHPFNAPFLSLLNIALSLSSSILSSYFLELTTYLQQFPLYEQSGNFWKLPIPLGFLCFYHPAAAIKWIASDSPIAAPSPTLNYSITKHMIPPWSSFLPHHDAVFQAWWHNIDFAHLLSTESILMMKR